mmetsp:Transcript_78923/g.231656  ORF Transcript_78923/g.231656 Transcript_78923/m.231656 type:complete len:378 (-) Transcript_78923:1175-2308(-)
MGCCLRLQGSRGHGRRLPHAREERLAARQRVPKAPNHRDLRPQPLGEAGAQRGEPVLARVASIAEEDRTEVVLVPDDAAQGLVHGADGLAVVPPAAVALRAAAVEEALLDDDAEVVARGEGDADHDHHPALPVREVNALAELAAADGGQDGPAAGLLAQGVVVAPEHGLHLVVPLGFLKDRLLVGDLLQEPCLPPAPEHALLHGVGLEGQQQAVGHVRGDGRDGRAEVLEVGRLVPLRKGGVQADFLGPAREHAAPELPPRVDDVGVLQLHRKRHPKGLSGALQGRECARGDEHGVDLAFLQLAHGHGAGEAPEAKGPGGILPGRACAGLGEEVYGLALGAALAFLGRVLVKQHLVAPVELPRLCPERRGQQRLQLV